MPNVIFWLFTKSLHHPQANFVSRNFRAVTRFLQYFRSLTGTMVKYAAGGGRNTPGYGYGGQKYE